MSDRPAPDAVVVLGRRRPPERIWLLAVAVLAGGLYLAGFAPPPSVVDAALPHWVRPVWYSLLLSGGLIGLVGIWWRDVTTGLMLERVAMVWLAAGMIAYTISIVWFAGPPGVGAALFLGGWAAALLARTIQISWDLRRVRHAGQAS
jgi:hypothetical protein